MLLGGLGVVGCTSSPAVSAGEGSSSCAAPVVGTLPDTVTPEQSITITGKWWGPCNDTNQAPHEPPWPSVTVKWVQHGQSTDITTVDVTGGRFNGELTIPSNASRGEASLRVLGKGYELDIPVSVDRDR
jgi:hypothetical protein